MFARLLSVGRRAKVAERFDAEAAFHVDMQTETNIRNGMSPEDARRDAMVHFGGRVRWGEATHDASRSRWLEALVQDLRFGGRTLRRNIAFTAIVVATLGIGIGANTAMFGAVNGVLLRPLPFTQPDRIVTLWQQDQTKGDVHDDVAPANFLDWRERLHSFTAIAAAEPYSLTYQTLDGPIRISNWRVTDDFFTILGVAPLRGRLFQPADFQTGAAPVVVLSYAGWQHYFHGDTAIIGRTVTIDHAPTQLIGVLPVGVAVPAGREMWTPKVFADYERQIRGTAFFRVIARLKPNVTQDQAGAELRTVAAQLAKEYAKTNANISATIVPLREDLLGKARSTLLLLFGAVGCVLLIACVNVANLLLERAWRRGREFALRRALGASTTRIIRQLLTESLLLAMLGALAGLALARWGIEFIRAMSPADLPRAEGIGLDIPVLIFAGVASCVTALVVGMLPAIRATQSRLHDELKSGGRSQSGNAGIRRVRAALVVSEVALAVVLLVGAGLLVRSFQALVQTDPGYRTDHIVTTSVHVWQWNPTPEQRASFVDQMVERLQALPGVTAAGATSALPLGKGIGAEQGSFVLEDNPVASTTEEPAVHVTVATPAVAAILGIPVRKGRFFSASDDANNVPVVVINESFARRYFGAVDPIGRRMLVRFMGAPANRQVIGVVGDIRQAGLETRPEPAVYVPHAQAPTGSVALIARTFASPVAFTTSLRRAITAMNPQLAIESATTMDLLYSDSLKSRRFNLTMIGGFAAGAFLLAIIGVYGVLSQVAIERTKEIGIRLALGARPHQVTAMVLRQGLGLAVIGTLGGLIGALALSQLLQKMLFEIKPVDPITYVAVPFVMLITTGVACYVPARRATGIDPISALRAE